MKWLIAIVIVLLELRGAHGDGFSEQVFREIHIGEGGACYRMFNKTHQFGCHATRKNRNGLIVRIEKREDFKDLESCYRSIYPEYHGKFWVLLPVNLIRKDTISILKLSNCTSGLVLHDPPLPMSPESSEEPGSHDSECPNAPSDFYTQNGTGSYCERKTNARGAIAHDGLMRMDWRLQMVFISNQTDLEVIRKCYEMFNQPGHAHYPYCGMTFKLENIGAGNAEICYRRGKNEAKLFQMNIDSGDAPAQCGAMHSENIFAFPTPISTSSNSTTTSRYLMVTSRMDSFGMIPEISVGELSVLTSIISVLAAARSMNQNIEKWSEASKKSGKNVFFSFFNGESLDYVGSGTASYQMEKGVFPMRESQYPGIRAIRNEDLDYIMEVQQVGVAKGRKYYVHLDEQRSSEKRVVDRMERGFRSHGFDLGVIRGRVPPSSWHSFAKSSSTVQSLLIAPFSEEYEYRRVNSVLDKNRWSSDEREKAIQEMEAVATAILAVSADYVGLDTDEQVAKVDRELIATLFDCLITSEFWFECPFMKRLEGGRYRAPFDAYGLFHKSTYISMESHTSFPTVLQWLTTFALGSDKETLNVKSEKSCSHLQEFQAMYTYTWQPNPYTGNFSCLKAATVRKVMISPAVDLSTPEEQMNERYSTWMESVYTIEAVKLYLMEDEAFEWTMLAIAIASALISIFAVGRCSESTFIVDEGEAAAEGGEPL